MTTLQRLNSLSRKEIIELAYKWELSEECIDIISRSHKTTIAFWIYSKIQKAQIKAILTLKQTL